MRTQLRIIGLGTAAVLVLGAMLVLFFQVRSDADIEVPEDALSQARAHYERSRIATGARDAPEARRADRGAVATRPSRPPERPAAVDRPPRRGRPSPSPPSQTMVPLDDVRAAYDRGDFESALELAELFLRDEADNDYIRRIAVVSACAMGEEATARRHYDAALARDRPIVAQRCARYDVQF